MTDEPRFARCELEACTTVRELGVGVPEEELFAPACADARVSRESDLSAHQSDPDEPLRHAASVRPDFEVGQARRNHLDIALAWRFEVDCVEDDAVREGGPHLVGEPGLDRY